MTDLPKINTVVQETVQEGISALQQVDGTLWPDKFLINTLSFLLETFP